VRPFELRLDWLQVQSTALELCAVVAGSPFAQAVSKLTLHDCSIEPPIAALRASFPNVLHFELRYCHERKAPSSIEAILAWPMLRSICLRYFSVPKKTTLHHLEAAARTAAELKAGQPFEIVLSVPQLAGNRSRVEAQVAAMQRAGGGLVAVYRVYNGSDTVSAYQHMIAGRSQ